MGTTKKENELHNHRIGKKDFFYNENIFKL